MKLVHKMEELDAVQHVLDPRFFLFFEINDALTLRPALVVGKNRYDRTICAAEFCLRHDTETVIRLEHRTDRINGNIFEEQVQGHSSP